MFLNANDFSDWQKLDARFEQQAQWTARFRSYLLRMFAKGYPMTVLEVGSGTGTVLRALQEENEGPFRFCCGVDVNREALAYSQKTCKMNCCQARGELLPFPDDSFDFVFCHFLLLWVHHPVSVLREMRRVTVHGGICAAMAEPCYEDMQAEPEPLARLANVQRERLAAAGADLKIGRDLGRSFYQAGFRYPLTNSYRSGEPDDAFLSAEISQMKKDCDDHSFVFQSGVKYIYHVPTYYAYAKK